MITSLQNPLVKNWKKLHSRKGREKQAAYLIEGAHLLGEALAHLEANAFEAIILLDSLDQADLGLEFPDSIPVYRIHQRVADHIKDTETSQGIFAVIKTEEADLDWENPGHLLLLDGIQDPGNLGTLIRTADAANYKAVLLGKGSVDLYNQKSLRSAQGSHFHIPVIKADLLDLIPDLQASGWSVYATDLNEGAVNYKEVEAQGPLALVLGNEAQGVSRPVSQLADQNIYIPMNPKTESLNVAVAGGILMFALKP